MSLNRLSLSATVHCLTGCAIGEIVDNVFILVVPGALAAGLAG